MKSRVIDRLNPSQLAELLDVGGQACWGPADGAAALRHQLALPLIGGAVGRDETGSEGRGDEVIAGTSVEALLLSPHSPVEKLRAIKMFARQVRGETANPLHGAP